MYKVELFYQFWNTTANAEKQLLQWLGEVGGLDDKQAYEVLDTVSIFHIYICISTKYIFKIKFVLLLSYLLYTC